MTKQTRPQTPAARRRQGGGGSRIAVPVEGDAACASCGAPRGNRSRGWVPIVRAGRSVGVTCPECPVATEPIRRIATASGGVRFRVVVDATPPGARERRQVTRTLPTLDAARAAVAAVRSEVERAGAYRAPDGLSVEALCDRWLASRRDIRPVTVESYRNVLRPVLHRIGSREVTAVTVRDIEALTEWLAAEGGRAGRDGERRPLSPRSVRAALVALAQAFDLAAHDDIVPRNVVRLARRPRQRVSVGRDLEHWQAAELLAFRAVADDDALAGAWRLTLCGLTRADVMGLRWSDIDLDAGTVTVRQGRVALDRGDTVDAPKSPQRRRTVPVEVIHPGTVGLLRRLSARQAADRLRAGRAWRESGFLVVDELGAPLRPEVYSDRFRRLCTRADVTSIRLHSVRHSLAFWLHSLGVPPADAAALLGHTVEVHLSTYLPESGASGIAAAAAALGRAAAAS